MGGRGGYGQGGYGGGGGGGFGQGWQQNMMQQQQMQMQQQAYYSHLQQPQGGGGGGWQPPLPPGSAPGESLEAKAKAFARKAQGGGDGDDEGGDGGDGAGGDGSDGGAQVRNDAYQKKTNLFRNTVNFDAIPLFTFLLPPFFIFLFFKHFNFFTSFGSCKFNIG